MLRIVPLAVLLAAGAAMLPGQAQAVGCVSGAAVGGVAGHFAGHHGVLGAAAGCVVGHHQAVVNRRNAAAAAAQRNTMTPQTTSGE